MPETRPHSGLLSGLLLAVLLVLTWSAIAPFDRFTWWLEVAPALIGLVVLAATRRRYPLTPLTYSLVALHMIILMVGGKYTYAKVPAGDWVAELFGFARNHYDRLGHFAQGFVPAMITREIMIRNNVLRARGWLGFLVVCVCLALSLSYELVEWAVAMFSHEAADSFLGGQGDPWDTQNDMFMALAGSLCAVLTLARWHDRQLRAFGAPQAEG